ncbi:mitochondrial inner membrane protein Mitofilin [Protomyces lactucae-debilis]|uniref:MICOS complex subunit MIC60 n=1 Tax=Protomyces lactucae-debilis TaxID=2754530 RepID=A0A1Y2FYX2_PROLT|nr:mitochondrial inner membrane protein Mitofilin [Protomyces lactucae-debilis]ORY87855.1 mitochondrial inner membrane protein Mitofilin [Protomyces lactucae-debilis]
MGSEPVVVHANPPPPPPPRASHRLRNTLLATILGGALLFGGGVYGSLQNDTVYEIFTEYVPYGEDAVLYIQEQEFRKRFPNATAQAGRSSTRASSASVYIPRSGAQARLHDPASQTSEAKILQPGPQNSALKQEHKATPGGANDAAQVNKSSPQLAPNAKSTQPAPKTGVESRSAPAASKETSEPAPADTKPADPASLTVPPPSAPLKPFEVQDVGDRVIERLQFALNGIITTANEYGSSSYFQACLENAKEEVLSLNERVHDIKKTEHAELEKKLTDQAKRYGEIQQQHIREVNEQIADYERRMTVELEQERERLNQAYTERLKEEVAQVEKLAQKKLQNELMEQAIELQRRFNREIGARVEEERGGRLGKLEKLEKGITELKQLNVEAGAFIEDRVKLQDLEVAMHALKNVLHEQESRPFIQELAAVKEIAGEDTLVRAAIGALDRETMENGIPTTGQLADRFRVVADEVRKAALLPEGAGIAGHATSALLSKVLFRKQGMVPGSDVEAILARTEAYLEANDLDSATREMNQLKGWPRLLSKDWMTMARRHLEVQQAVDILEQSVVLSALRMQQS